MLAFSNYMLLFHSGGALLKNMGPARRSLRVAVRSLLETSAPTAANGLVTPRRSLNISKARLKQFESLRVETETEGESSDKSDNEVFSEEFSLGGQGLNPKGIKRKLNFDPKFSAMSNLEYDPTTKLKLRGRNVKAQEQKLARSQEAVADTVKKEFCEEVPPFSARWHDIEIETKGKGEEEHTEIGDIEKPEPRECGAQRKRKLPNSSVFARAAKVKKEEDHGEEEKKEIRDRVMRKTAREGVKIPESKMGNQVKADEGHNMIDDIVKPEPTERTGPRGIKRQVNAFAKVKVKIEGEQKKPRARKVVMQEAGAEDKQRKRKPPGKKSSALPTDPQRGRSASAKAQKSTSPGLELVTVRPVGGAQLASENDSAIITLAGPYPSYARPFPEECQQARDLLSHLHGHLPEYERYKQSCPTIEQHVQVERLQSLAPASMELKKHGYSGDKAANSGNVELALTLRAPSAANVGQKKMIRKDERQGRGSVLDSLVGTLLAQNTTDNNARKAFASLKRTFPTWEKVLRADPKKVEDAIRCGGLAVKKATRIRTILETLLEEKGEISMEYIQYMSNEDIKLELSRFKGVGPKTVACVLMFHLQRTEFPVDTHVFRISKMLGWVPENADREKAYLHLNQRIPDFLKYDIHCLFVTHGKGCPNCAKRHNQKPPDGPCPLLNWKTKWSKAGISPLKLGSA